jgi:predicted site-specific integrase-resolvase
MVTTTKNPSLPIFLPLPEAARKYGVSEARLKTMIDNGKIKAAMIGEEFVVSEEEVQKASLRKEDTLEYKKFEHLKGHAIWLSQAERKYGVRNQTIFGWVQRGFIKKLGKEGNKVLIDEADVAYCVEIYRRSMSKQGRRIFDKQGLPYKPKTGPLSLNKSG